MSTKEIHLLLFFTSIAVGVLLSGLPDRLAMKHMLKYIHDKDIAVVCYEQADRSSRCTIDM
jgi:hypothetical protein